MQPIDVAEKWTSAAQELIREGTRHVTSPLAITLDQRVRAHYGETWDSALDQNVIAVAMVEAMNEWQMIRSSPICHMCAKPIMPTEAATFLSRGGAVHADRPECAAPEYVHG